MELKLVAPVVGIRVRKWWVLVSFDFMNDRTLE